MTDNKFTDKEIIKSLECCKRDFSMRSCLDCPYNGEKSAKCMSFMIEDVLALINRQQAEVKEQVKLIDRLQIENDFIKNKALAEGKTTATAIMAEYEQHRMTAEYINKLKAEIERLSHKCDDCAGCTSWLCDCSNVRAEAIKEYADDIYEEIDKAIKNNQDVKKQRRKRLIWRGNNVEDDTFLHYVEGKLDALKGIKCFVCDYVKEMVGE